MATGGTKTQSSPDRRGLFFYRLINANWLIVIAMASPIRTAGSYQFYRKFNYMNIYI